MIEITVFPMTGDSCAEYPDQITHWDVLVQLDDPENRDPIEEHEDLLTEDAVLNLIDQLLLKYPDASVDWVPV